MQIKTLNKEQMAKLQRESRAALAADRQLKAYLAKKESAKVKGYSHDR